MFVFIVSKSVLTSLFWHRKVCVRTNLDLIGPSEAFELPQPHVLGLHSPLPAGRTLVRALPCQHHDAPARSKREDGYFTFLSHTFTLN